MPAKAPTISAKLEKALQELGGRLRDRRKKLKISSVGMAEAAGISRITLYRIERGEASVAMSGYISVIVALGLSIELIDFKSRKMNPKDANKSLPRKIRIADYKQLKRIAWQLKDTKQISPKEALDLYERNWRHVDARAMDAREQKLVEMLLAAFGRERLLV